MIVGSMREGIARALASPLLILWLCGANVLCALPAAWALSESIQRSAGDTLVADRLLHGFDTTWHGEFAEKATGVDATFRPEVTGPGAFLDNLEAWITGSLFEQPALLLGLGLVWLLVWLLFQGGILDRCRRVRQPSLRRFLGSGGRYFFRFARLAVLSGVAYFGIYKLIRWAYDRLGDWTRDVTSERELLAYSLVVLAAGALLLILVHMSFAYAKIATVVEERRSMLLAALRGISFVLSHPLGSLGVYAGPALAGLALVALHVAVAPGAGQSTATAIVLAFLLAQLFLAGKLVVRVALLAAQTSYYRRLTPGS